MEYHKRDEKQNIQALISAHQSNIRTAANNNYVRAETAEVVRSYGQNVAVTDGSRNGYGDHPIVGVSSMLSNSVGNGSIIHNAQQLNS
jgi:hypothetical protein